MKRALRLAILLCTPALFAQVSTPPDTAQTPSSRPASTAGPKGFVLEDGTPVRLRINRTVSSADAQEGDSVDFEVLEDVQVDNVLVVPKGGLAFATVTEAQNKRRMARGGKLDINIDYVRLLSSEHAPLRAVKEVKGGGHTAAMTGGIVATSLVFFPAAPFFLFMHGKDITIPKGTEITAYVSGDMKLDPAKFHLARAPSPATGSTASTNSVSGASTAGSSATASPATDHPSTAAAPAAADHPAADAGTPAASHPGTETSVPPAEQGPPKQSPAEPSPAKQGPAESGPAASPASSTNQVQLQISSTPAAADIEIDGSFVGSTPSTVGVASGQHQLSVKKPGFKPWERKITVSTGQVTVNATLEAEQK